ncbi:HD domain-containing protein [Bacillus testis]|uniref:HD domain-containing protein n=1 Tax=Bacillus testis TaxID=1622072 RepID=UPI000A7BED01|nr:HD domain-containing protein [Bacillus testis]
MNQLDKAQYLAEKAHAGQTRKNSDEPYAEHPKRVARILQEAGFPDAVIIAGYLHDTVEDTEVTPAVIEEQFGPDVARLVAAHTENKTLSWEERKEHTIQTVKEGPMEVKALIVADKLDNLQALQKHYEEQGSRVWDAFKRGREKQAWYNQSIADAIKDIPQPPAFFKQYIDLVETFFGDRPDKSM